MPFGYVGRSCHTPYICRRINEFESQQDPFRSADRVKRLAARTGASVATLPDAGHFWMLEAPEQVAEILTKFWAGI